MATVKKLQTLFSKLGIEVNQRHERINAWTSGRVQSAKDLQDDELIELCASLSNEFDKRKAKETELKKKKKSIILTIATRTGIKSPHDWDSFNYFMLHTSLVKKSLNLCSLDELDGLINQFRAIEQNNAKSAQKAGTKAYFNQFGLPAIGKN
ncbi:conserved hypothetical protein [Flavobacterium psychrophilum]|uniref:hypothetical protein n=1 Tax=Flavobacterium psychrophilum TaxID=96345 RepID=UPI000B7C2CC4|nr:hypothetical protein [Flavobacterium psychrophilum]SNA83241.1 conserved hypothetical protein [Flavobacterium psychrophilum]